MLQGILDGVVDCIATDHAPHAAHEKEQEFERAPNGITGLETALGLSLSLFHKAHRLPIGRVINLLSTQPAAVLGLKGRGTLAVGVVRRRGDLRCKEGMDLPRRKLQIQIEEHAVRRLDDAGRGALDDQ